MDTTCYTPPSIALRHHPWCSGLRPRPCRISCRQNLYFCLIRRLYRQKYQFFFLLKTSPCAFSSLKHCPGVGGIVVSIAAFQAVDPGSIPGRRSHFVHSANIYEQFSFNFGLSLLNVTRLCDSLLPPWMHEHKKGWLENAIFFSELFHHFSNPAGWSRVVTYYFFHFNSLSMLRRYSTPQNFERFHCSAQRRFHISTSGFASSRWQHYKRFSFSHRAICSRVGGIVVSIAAFQAVDPGSIPGRRN